MRTCRILVYRRVGGLVSETFVREQFEHLATARIHYDLNGLKHGPSQQLRKLAQTSSYAIGRVPTRLSRLVDSYNPQAALIHFGTNAVAVGPGLRRKSIRTFPIFHGHDATVSKGFGVYSDRRICGEIERSTITFCVSNFIKNRLAERGAPTDKMEVHYTGIPLDQIPTRNHPLDDRTGILFVGRLVEKKGAADLVRAYALLSADLRRRHRLTIVGEGPQSGPLRALADALAVNCLFLGAVENERVRAMMQERRVTAVPSKTAENGDAEGLGHVALEAQAAGCPIAGYESGGLPEGVLHGRTGILVPEGDVTALAEALETELCNDQAWSRMSTAGAELVRSKFDLARNTAHLQQRICRAVT